MEHKEIRESIDELVKITVANYAPMAEKIREARKKFIELQDIAEKDYIYLARLLRVQALLDNGLELDLSEIREKISLLTGENNG